MGTRKLILGAVLVCVGALAGARARADEIRLKDGQKLYGVIVAYEDNMFKVKTDFGFVLVEKDKIAAIIPAGSAGHSAAKPDKPDAAKPAPQASTPRRENPAPVTPAPVPVPVKSSAPPSAPKLEKTGKTAAVKPASTPAPAPAPVPDSAARSTPVGAAAAPKPPLEKKPSPTSSDAAVTAKSATPAAPTSKPTTAPAVPVVTPIHPSKPKEIEPPPNREAVQGNLYINYTHGFRMYKAPSWKLIEDAPKALPNAIVALGTSNESTLLVVGQEKNKASLEVTAADVEKRLRDTYGNYRRISLIKTVVGGFPAIEIKYRGLADDHDWSGTLLVVSRSGDMFSVLGMTYAETDLIQIQENVIARAIASLEFNSN